MRVLVDTSVWVDFFNQRPSSQALQLSALIEAEVEVVTCGVVIAEFFQGLRHDRSRAALETQFRDMPILAPREPDTYFEAADLYRQLRVQGITVRSTIDCLIVQLAAEAAVFLLAKDRDIRLILESGLSRARGVPAF